MMSWYERLKFKNPFVDSKQQLSIITYRDSVWQNTAQFVRSLPHNDRHTSGKGWYNIVAELSLLHFHTSLSTVSMDPTLYNLQELVR